MKFLSRWLGLAPMSSAPLRRAPHRADLLLQPVPGTDLALRARQLRPEPA